MKIDLEELERKARAAIDTRENAPKSLEGEPLVTVETACAAWDHQQANSPPVTLALVARIRELEAEIREWIEIYEEDPRDFTQCRQLLEKGAVLP